MCATNEGGGRVHIRAHTHAFKRTNNVKVKEECGECDCKDALVSDKLTKNVMHKAEERHNYNTECKSSGLQSTRNSHSDALLNQLISVKFQEWVRFQLDVISAVVSCKVLKIADSRFSALVHDSISKLR